MTPNHLAEQRDKLAHTYYLNNGKDFPIKRAFKNAFDAAIPLAFAERDRMILDLMKNKIVESVYQDHYPLFTARQLEWLEEELKKRDGK
jgi:hypothetical protein